jgi:hypothetical protein
MLTRLKAWYADTHRNTSTRRLATLSRDNAVWSKYSADRIAGFFSEYMNFRRDPFQPSSLAATFTQMEQVYRAPMDSPTIATGKCHIC